MLSRRSRLYWLVPLLTLALLTNGPVPPSMAAPIRQETQPKPNVIQQILYFNSAPQDDDSCTLAPNADGSFTFGEGVTNPAMTCPDAFAWKLFVEALQEKFWLNWAADKYTWPNAPLPLCTNAPDGTPCCDPNSLTNPGYKNAGNPAKFCPYYPGDHLTDGTLPENYPAQPLAKSQVHAFALQAATVEAEPGRTIRQEAAELVFRNKPMVDYIFTNNIYHTIGLQELFVRNSHAMSSTAPYRQRNTPGGLISLDFPIGAVMIKSNWITAKQIEELGLNTNPDANPYITMEINSPVVDNNAPDAQWQKDIYYLVAFHISSKDIPNWVWATFEHVNNPGRCDYTGCNDSFGYTAPDAVSADQYPNFTAPHIITDGLIISSPVFATGELYADGERTAELQTLFDDLGIGSEEQGDPTLPTPESSGWLSYRLKGSQINFTDSTGRATLLGNSITEGGFVSTSSCISCHARAAIDEQGGAPLGVFVAQLNEAGYPQSVHNVPDPDWYYTSSNHPSLLALQTDFVWGFLFANPLTNTVRITP